MPKKFYEKDADGNLIEAGWEFRGFPADGIWYVRDGKQNLIEYIQPARKVAPDLRYDYLAMADDLAAELQNVLNGRNASLREVAAIACEFFSTKGQAQAIEQCFFLEPGTAENVDKDENNRF